MKKWVLGFVDGDMPFQGPQQYTAILPSGSRLDSEYGWIVVMTGITDTLPNRIQTYRDDYGQASVAAFVTVTGNQPFELDEIIVNGGMRMPVLSSEDTAFADTACKMVKRFIIHQVMRAIM